MMLRLMLLMLLADDTVAALCDALYLSLSDLNANSVGGVVYVG